MRNLRALHLYLGCLFAPMLLFFSVSGIWQLFGLEWPQFGKSDNILTLLSTIHTGHQMSRSAGHSLTSIYMKWFVLAMTVSFIATLVLGIILALKYQRPRGALICLGLGVAIPVALALLAFNRSSG